MANSMCVYGGLWIVYYTYILSAALPADVVAATKIYMQS